MSNLTNEQNTIFDCRYCHMCRHICPIGKHTGKEIHHPRGRALILSTLFKGKKMDSDIARMVYECALCGGCIEQCVTGHDPTVFTRAARTEAVVEDLVPETVNHVIHNLMNVGNPFGIPQTEKDKGFGDAIKDLPKTADVLLFIGCTNSYKTPKTAMAAINLFKKAKVNFTVLQDEKCCGLYLADLIGKVEESRQQGLRVAEQVKDSGAKTVVALCPSCTKAFKREYREWGIDLPTEICSITSYLAGLLDEGRLQPRKLDTQVTFHDPCRLARDLEETEPARKIIDSMGMNLKEMFFNRAKTHCCGGGLLDLYASELTALTAKGRWDEASRKADTMVVACSSCQLVMEKARPENMQLKNIVETLWEQCASGR
jgi:Fe-S oxidoreductase